MVFLRGCLCVCSLTPSLLSLLLARTPSLFFSRPLPPKSLISKNPQAIFHCSIGKSLPRTLSTAAASLPSESSLSRLRPVPMRSSKKSRRESPAGVLLHKLCMCAKKNDLPAALGLYDDARWNGIPLGVDHYNKLLYLCGNSSMGLGLERGFEIYKQMGIDNVSPNEATFTNAARLAAAKEDPELAFDLVKKMKENGIVPKLRSYVPALFGFCKKGMADKAYEVDLYMIENGVLAEESELSELLSVSCCVKNSEKVYEILHRLRANVRQVSEETAKLIEEWFSSETASEVGEVNWDAEKVRKGVVNGGGGWHGQGWLGSGKWKVVRTEMDKKGVCCSCGEKLVPIDIDTKETENFASSLSTLACQREVKADFLQFQEWLKKSGPFDAVVDGANVGHIKQQTFSFSQLKTVVNMLREKSPSKCLPLVVLHRARAYGSTSQSPGNKKLLQFWKESGALYATPQGSNDDWYWLYAAVSSKCLLVTNDEMRDHLFELLGTSFFPRWKEKHQVRLSFSDKGLSLHMPPPYSIVIQESELGSWHVPTVTGDDIETRRQWICATRTKGLSLQPCSTGNPSS